MKTIAAAEFKAKCLALINRVHGEGESITITKRGRTVARPRPRRRRRAPVAARAGHAAKIRGTVPPQPSTRATSTPSVDGQSRSWTRTPGIWWVEGNRQLPDGFGTRSIACHATSARTSPPSVSGKSRCSSSGVGSRSASPSRSGWRRPPHAESGTLSCRYRPRSLRRRRPCRRAFIGILGPADRRELPRARSSPAHPRRPHPSLSAGEPLERPALSHASNCSRCQAVNRERRPGQAGGGRKVCELRDWPPRLDRLARRLNSSRCSSRRRPGTTASARRRLRRHRPRWPAGRGRLYVARWSDEIRIVDIALLPRLLQPRPGDDAGARAPGGRSRRQPEAAAHPRRAFQSRAAALRAPRVPSDCRQRCLLVHGVAGDEECTVKFGIWNEEFGMRSRAFKRRPASRVH